MGAAGERRSDSKRNKIREGDIPVIASAVTGIFFSEMGNTLNVLTFFVFVL